MTDDKKKGDFDQWQRDDVGGNKKAAAQLRHHAERAPGKAIHLAIDARNNASLGLAPPRGGEIEVDFGGVPVLMDPLTAGRADGLEVDFDEGKGFRIETA